MAISAQITKSQGILDLNINSLGDRAYGTERCFLQDDCAS